MRETGLGPREVTALLWERYDPGQVWLPFAVTALVAGIAMLAFGFVVRRSEGGAGIRE